MYLMMQNPGAAEETVMSRCWWKRQTEWTTKQLVG